MLKVLSWWLLVELIGLAVLPVAFRFFRNLPDRGYAFIKPLGLLLIAYPFWLLTTFGFLTNTRGVIAVVALLVALASWFFVTRPPSEKGGQRSAVGGQSSLGDWLRANKSIVIATELVFTVAFFSWAIVRAYMPEITATEKPMEFAFLNGVLQSETFPPRDPWLAGYAISYYYFGYIIVAILTMLSGVASSSAFNLAIALLFALAATGAFGLAYNLIQGSLEISDRRVPQSPTSNLQSLVSALFAPVFLVLIGNLQGFFESLHALGVGSREFWMWFDVKGLLEAPVTGTFAPQDNWWWWRSSRVIHDVALGQTQEVIDEFPQFSFLLGDMHPHVLALPFVLLALAVALNLIRNSKFGIQNSNPGFRIPNSELRIANFEFLIYPLILGGLFFLNSWDILPYGFILVAAFAVARYRVERAWNSGAMRDLIVFIVALFGASVLMYLPFYLGFQSQAGGILPVLFVKTRLHQYVLMFGLFVFLLVFLVVALMREHRGIATRDWLNLAAPFLAALAAFPLAIALIATTVFAISPAVRASVSAAVPDAGGLIAAYFGPLRNEPWLFILFLILLPALGVLLRVRVFGGASDDQPETFAFDASGAFVVLLALTGFLLTFGVEFAYLRDQFGTRMNTVFKFYFQAWTLFAIASAYAVFYLARVLNGVARVAWVIGLTGLMLMSVVYPAFAISDRAEGFKKAPTLDGLAWIRATNPGDYAAMEWLNANAPRGAVIAEAVGGEYSYGNRISMATGLATPLGWAGHESQWRGNSQFFKDDALGIDRAGDLARLYQTLSTAETLTLLDKYAINFVVVGGQERAQYGLSKSQMDKFAKVMQLVFEDGDVRIYAR
ncbi:MAG: hypothetical protein HY868_24945 [Chloroflexi bacterium]|nr:hypothetical protein [Chloroflexota bacterium]